MAVMVGVPTPDVISVHSSSLVRGTICNHVAEVNNDEFPNARGLSLSLKQLSDIVAETTSDIKATSNQIVSISLVIDLTTFVYYPTELFVGGTFAGSGVARCQMRL